ncbi:MAG TPA: cupin domain-containing protein [Thermoguttaceae bacterium]|nr:cupin domain-containing protein [Thermoguttaceae bacterium]
MLRRHGAVLLVVASICLVAAGSAAAEDPPAETPEKIDAQSLATMVQSFDKVEKLEHPWGWIRWLMSSKLDPKAEMTFGLVEIKAGQRNPMHIHPNCEEILYVLSGSCEHWLDKEKCVLKAGDVIRIPTGVPHYARTFEKEGMKAVIVYSSGDRQFEEVEEK